MNRKKEEVNKVEETVVPMAEAAEQNESSQVENTPMAEEAKAATAETERKTYASKKEVLERIREIARSEEAPRKDEIDQLKTAFYKMHIAEREAAFKAYTDGGGDPKAISSCPTRTKKPSRQK